MFRIPLLLAPLLLSGCSTALSGIWLLTFIVDDETESTCDTTIRENFINGYVPGGTSSPDSNWTYTETFDPPDATAFAQVETTIAGEAVLVYGGLAYPGTKTDAGWEFEWVTEQSQGSTEEHSSGYRFTSTTENASTTTITLEPSGDTAAGVVKSGGTATQSYTEADELDFDDDDIDEVTDQYGLTGQIPSTSYLVREDSDNDEVPQTNSFDEDDDDEGNDCESDTCELAIESTCTLNVRFDAEKTDYREEAAYAHLVGAGQGSI